MNDIFDTCKPVQQYGKNYQTQKCKYNHIKRIFKVNSCLPATYPAKNNNSHKTDNCHKRIRVKIKTKKIYYWIHKIPYLDIFLNLQPNLHKVEPAIILAAPKKSNEAGIP